MQPEPQTVPTPAANTPRSLSRRRLLLVVLATVVVAAVVAAVPLAAPLSWGLAAHYECGPGAVIATRDLWTPDVLVNSPYGGFGNGTGTYPIAGGSSSTTVGAANGEAVAEFELQEWSIAPSVRVIVAGPGANAVCSGFVATAKPVGGYIGAILLQRGATSNAGENTSVSFTDPYGNQYDSVRFDNGYAEADRSYDSCAGGPSVMAPRSSGIAVEVPFTWEGSSHLASGSIAGAFNYTYRFPEHFGTWSIDDLSIGTHAPGGGWAFSFTPCP